MAKAAKKAATHPTDAVKRPDRGAIQRAVAEVNRQKELAASYTGNAGQETKTFCERWNINKIAFAYVRKLAGMEDQKRQAVLIDTADLCKGMGFTDQADFFVDAAAAVEGLKGEGAEGPDPAEVAAKTAEEQAQAPGFVTKTHRERTKDRLNAEVGDALAGTVQ